jgi:MFS family permease
MKPQTRRMSKAAELARGWLPLLTGVLGVATCFAIVNGNSAGAFIRPLTHEFGWTRAQVSSAATITSIVTALTAPLGGRLADRFGPRPVIAISIVGAAVGFFLQSLNPGSLAAFLLVQGIMAAVGAGASTVTYTMLVTYWFDRARGLAMGLVTAGSGLTSILAPWLLLPLVERSGWRAGYRGVALAVILMLPLALVGARRPRKEPAEHASAPEVIWGATLQEAARSRQFWLQGIALLLGGACISGLFVHLVPMLLDRGLPTLRAASIASLLGLAVVAGRLGSGYLLDRVFAPWVAVGLVLLAAAGIFALMSPSLVVAALGVALVGLAFGSEIDVSGYMTARYFGTRAYGAIYGWQYGLFIGGGVLSPVFYGYVRDRFGGYELALAGSAALIIASLPLFLLMRPYPQAHVE